MTEYSMHETTAANEGRERSALRQWAPVLLILCVLAFYVYASRPVSAPPGWEEDYAVAIETARSSGRKLVLAFHSQGCPPCAAMDRTVLRTEEVQQALRHFVPVRVDAWTSSDLAQRYGVFATPSYVVTLPDGTPVGRADGFLSKDQFVSFLNQAS